jgi:hypothetical protein
MKHQIHRGRAVWDSVTGLVAEIKKCEEARATTAAVVIAYVCIDTMTFLSLPPGRESQGRADFIAWVDAYLKGHPEQVYQYRGLDVYGVRCAMLHSFSAEGDFHQQNPDVKKFGYHDGGKHAYDPTVDEHLVIIGTASLLNDVIHAVTSFMEACMAGADLRLRAEACLPRILATFPFAVG